MPPTPSPPPVTHLQKGAGEKGAGRQRRPRGRIGVYSRQRRRRRRRASGAPRTISSSHTTSRSSSSSSSGRRGGEPLHLLLPLQQRQRPCKRQARQHDARDVRAAQQQAPARACAGSSSCQLQKPLALPRPQRQVAHEQQRAAGVRSGPCFPCCDVLLGSRRRHRRQTHGQPQLGELQGGARGRSAARVARVAVHGAVHVRGEGTSSLTSPPTASAAPQHVEVAAAADAACRGWAGGQRERARGISRPPGGVPGRLQCVERPPQLHSRCRGAASGGCQLVHLRRERE